MAIVANFHQYKSKEKLTELYGNRWMYVGRANKRYGLARSPLANPFSSDPQDKATYSPTPIDDYREWLWGKIKQGDTAVLNELAKIIPDTILVCWCHPAPCHAQVLQKAADWVALHLPELKKKTAVQLPTVALSIRQPWAWLVVRPDVVDPVERQRLRYKGLIKDIENREWRGSMRGWFYVHASKQFDEVGYRWVLEQWPMIELPTKEALEMGGIIGMARMTADVTDHTSRWFFGPHGFVLPESKPLPFRPLAGRLNFFNVPRDETWEAGVQEILYAGGNHEQHNGH